MESIERQSRRPKYLELADYLRGQVQTGELRPGDQLPSFVELRARYQISRGTVEKVHVLLEQDGLIVREQGRGVFVASPKTRERTGMIGFVGDGFLETQASLYWAHIIQGIQGELSRAKMQLLLLNSSPDAGLWDKVDGVLLGVNEEKLAPTLTHLPAGLPCVSLLTPSDEVGSVLTDDYLGAKEATRHLIALGHRRIGLLVAGHNQIIEQRMAGYQDALREIGVEPRLSWVRPLKMRTRPLNSKEEFVEQGRRCLIEWLNTRWAETGCTAIFAQNDHAAVGAIEALQSAGLRVPEDISVVGFDGTETYDYFSPRLTTVEVPLQQIGAAAAQMLLQKIRGSSPSERIVLPTHFRAGASTAVVPTKDSLTTTGNEIPS